MQIRTHLMIDGELCGKPIAVSEGNSRVRMHATDRMAADDTGLVHGGFIFGLADYAAMIAVNHPHVVLGAAEVKFLKPVRVGETVTAEAAVKVETGKKRMVDVTVRKGEETVFSGAFVCFVLDRHVLD